MSQTSRSPEIAAVIPCYKVRDHILSVLDRIGPEVGTIYVVDDACPEGSGAAVRDLCRDPRVRVLFNQINLGVGGATLAGMRAAAADGAEVIVKIDGDGQMDPALVPAFVRVIASGDADYAKGNRFFEPESLAGMPAGRLIGNAALSFLSKISSGYWHSFDPTNGYIAIHASLVDLLPHDKIAPRYFFESDMLFRLNILTARVVDVPMQAHYGPETSGLRPLAEIPRFARGHLRNFGKRIVYNYFIRNFSIASLELLLGLCLVLFGTFFGLTNWSAEETASAGTVMLAALPVIVGFQLLIAFLNYDIASVPSLALHPRLRASGRVMRSLANTGTADRGLRRNG